MIEILLHLCKRKSLKMLTSPLLFSIRLLWSTFYLLGAMRVPSHKTALEPHIKQCIFHTPCEKIGPFPRILARSRTYISIWTLLKNVKLFFEVSKGRRRDPLHEECGSSDLFTSPVVISKRASTINTRKFHLLPY